MRIIKTLPHASRGWWGGLEEGIGEDRVLYVTDTDLEVQTPEIELELEKIEILLEIEIEEIELEDD